MKGFIEVTYLDRQGNEFKRVIHYSQIYFISNNAYWNDNRIKESYEEIKQLIKDSTNEN